MEIIECRGVKFPNDPAIISPKIAKNLRKEFYETAEALGLPKFLKKKDRVLEIGAGIGFISSFVALEVGVGDITCVEANPVLVDYIRSVHDLNDVDNSTICNAVLLPDNASFPAAGTLPFNVTVPFWSSSFENPKSLPSTVVATPAKYLSEMIEECDPTVIICDIEGGEVALFEEANFRNVTRIYVEIHPRYIGMQGVQKLFKDLHRHNFTYNPRASEGTQVLFSRVS